MSEWLVVCVGEKENTNELPGRWVLRYGCMSKVRSVRHLYYFTELSRHYCPTVDSEVVAR